MMHLYIEKYVVTFLTTQYFWIFSNSKFFSTITLQTLGLYFHLKFYKKKLTAKIMMKKM